MIQAVLEGKSLGYEYMEDMLTSVVFGTLKYIQPSTLLIPFIEAAFLYDERRTTLWEKLKSEGIELRGYRDTGYYFWAYHKTYGEPDLILLFKNHIHGVEDLLLVIEAKFKSNKSGVGDKDQLARYCKAIDYNNIEDFSEPELTSFKGKRGYIIYLTESIASSEIDESERIIVNSSYGKNKIFHLRWHQLYHTYEKMQHYFSTKVEEAIVYDLMEFMENLGLRDFSGISPPPDSLISELSRPFPIFYFENNVMNDKATYFDYTSSFSFMSEDIIFYGG